MINDWFTRNKKKWKYTVEKPEYSYEDLQSKLGIYEIDDPSSISIYPKDYASKEKIEELINKYNKDKPEDLKN